jgi:hypothetical protein
MQEGTLYPAYIRGQAYLLAHNGTAAAAEFQKLLEHRSILLNFVTGALAHLQLSRVYATAGDTAKARTAYQDFLTLWKDADPNIPNPEGSQGGVREAAMSERKLSGWRFC